MSNFLGSLHSLDTPSYGDAEGGNLNVTVYVISYVSITFNPKTHEITCDIQELGESEIKFQFKANASINDDTVDLRIITYVTSLNYDSVCFFATIDGVTSAPMVCTTVYETIEAKGIQLSCEDIFGIKGYLVAYTLEDIPASMYDKVIKFQGSYAEDDIIGTMGYARTVVISEVL